MWALLLLLLSVAPVCAQNFDFFRRGDTRPPASKAEIGLSFAPVVKAAAPAVVNVYGTQRAEARNPFRGDPFFERFFGFGGRERARQSVGSGVLVSADGFVITNHHVIEGMTEIRIALADRREFEAEVRLRDPKTDLAVLKLKTEATFPFLALGDSDTLEVGDLVLAIGNPFGVGQTVTQGIVSALARTQVGVSDYQFFIQTDAAINPGNSGGALVDTAGRVVGINTAIFSRSGGSHGIGFAIPANMVRSVLDSAKAGGGVVRRPWFGASLQVVTAHLAESLKLPRPAGALVSALVPGGPAEKAGLKRLDAIVAVDGAAVDDPDAFGFRLATRRVGGNAKLRVVRAGSILEISLPLVAAPEVPAREPVAIRANNPFGGLTVVNFSPAVREEFSIDGADSGLVVAEIEPGSPAEQVGFRKGDLLIALNGQRLTRTADLERAAASRTYLWRVTFARGGQVFTSAFGG